MKAIGRRAWAIPGGHIPLQSSGPEPEFTSRDEIVMLNLGDDVAQVEMTMIYADRDPVGPYCLAVGARRVRRVRCNDLIDPEAMPLGVDYAIIIESNAPIVVQFDRIDTSPSPLTRGSIAAIPIDL
jgi:hypothetical protein